jgi:hypothetical protein
MRVSLSLLLRPNHQHFLTKDPQPTYVLPLQLKKMLKVLRMLQLLFCKCVAEIRVAASSFGQRAFLRSFNSVAGGGKAMHRSGREDYRSHCRRNEPHFCRSHLVQCRLNVMAFCPKLWSVYCSSLQNITVHTLLRGRYIDSRNNWQCKTSKQQQRENESFVCA